MLDEPFAERASPIHSLDPRARLVAAIVGALCFSFMRDTATACAALGCSLIPLCLCNPPWRFLAQRVLLVNLFIGFLWLTVPATMPGDTVFALGPLRFSAPGLRLALLVTLKSNAILFLCIALTATMPLPTAGSALRQLGMPEKLVVLILFTYRYIHTIDDEWHRLQTAAKLRGFVPKTNPHTYATIAGMLGAVLLRSFDRAARVHEAMRLRGFDGPFRTVAEYRGSIRDALFLAAACAVPILLLALDAPWSLPHG